MTPELDSHSSSMSSRNSSTDEDDDSAALFDVSQIWEDAATMRGQSCVPCGNDEEDQQDAFGNSKLAERARACRESIVRFSCGDIHVCDANCEFAEVTKDGSLVCPYSGIVVGMAAVERTDFSTGRSTWSADPDSNGGQPVGGAWKKRIDGAALSKQAHAAATMFDDTQMPEARTITRVDPLLAKKSGARCLDEDDGDHTDSGSRYKKQRTTKKEMSSSVDSVKLLVIEADGIYGKLVVNKREPPTQPQAGAEVSSALAPALPSFDKLFQLSLERYLSSTRTAGTRPNMDTIQELALGVDAAVRAAAEAAQKKALLQTPPSKKAASTSTDTDKPRAANICFDVNFRSTMTRLSIAIWNASCSAQFFSLNKRGADSFRPFQAGCLYALKRGLHLKDGTVLVPAVPEFASAVITAKQAGVNAQLKSLAASCHRGLSSVHRSISSVPPEKQASVFFDALALSRELQAIINSHH